MKTFLHVGQHKTGTTSTQKFLADNRQYFLDQGLVPQTVCGRSENSHIMLCVYALNADRFNLRKTKIKASGNLPNESDFEHLMVSDISRIFSEAKNCGCNTVLFTSESMYLLRHWDEYKRLEVLLRPHSENIHAVCCFREKSSYKKSFLMQLNGRNSGDATDQDDCYYFGEDSYLLQYDSKLKLLRSVFDEASSFEYDPSDNVKKFFRHINYPCELDTNVKLNVTTEKQ